jgi:hypothetical protein
VSGDELGIYVYGVVPLGNLSAVPALPGVDEARYVRLVAHGELGAVVSDVDLQEFDDEPLRAHLADMSWVERIARCHERVLDALIERCTPIPMRLCTVYRDEQGVRRMLMREHDNLTLGLQHLQGRLEWGVKAYASERPSSASREDPAAADPVATSGTAYLQGRLAARQAGERIQHERERACEELHAELCTASVAGRLGALHRPEVSGRDAAMLLNGFYLVEGAQRDAFMRRAAELSETMSSVGLELELTGPWPPYNFVPEAIGGGL